MEILDQIIFAVLGAVGIGLTVGFAIGMYVGSGLEKHND